MMNRFRLEDAQERHELVRAKVLVLHTRQASAAAVVSQPLRQRPREKPRDLGSAVRSLLRVLPQSACGLHRRRQAFRSHPSRR